MESAVLHLLHTCHHDWNLLGLSMEFAGVHISIGSKECGFIAG
jgi:hypothetical protein